MASFTMVLKDVLSYQGGIIDEMNRVFDGATIGLGEYPIFDETYRDRLNAKIIDHFWNREIGQETVSMFKLALRRKMNEIMPLYNQQYTLGLINIDPLSTVSLSTISDSTGTANSTSDSNAKGRTVVSDTPQVPLSGNGDYATGLTDATSDTTGTGSSSDTRNNSSTTTGYQGQSAELVFRARQLLVNVDMMVIEELEPLFMLIWGNGDDYFYNANGLGGYFV